MKKVFITLSLFLFLSACTSQEAIPEIKIQQSVQSSGGVRTSPSVTGAISEGDLSGEVQESITGGIRSTVSLSLSGSEEIKVTSLSQSDLPVFSQEEIEFLGSGYSGSYIHEIFNIKTVNEEVKEKYRYKWYSAKGDGYGPGNNFIGITGDGTRILYKALDSIWPDGYKVKVSVNNVFSFDGTYIDEGGFPIYDIDEGILLFYTSHGIGNTLGIYDIHKKEYYMKQEYSNGISINYGENRIINEQGELIIQSHNFSRNYLIPYASDTKYNNPKFIKDYIVTKEDIGKNILTIKNPGMKDFVINFSDVRNKKENMPRLMFSGNSDSNILGTHFLSLAGNKQSGEYIIYFNKNIIEDALEGLFEITKATVKNIGIISCSANNSNEYDKEYTLTADENGNFTYNISEELGNKCDIPYKIQVTYEDGTKELGEYYILFDY